MDTDMDYTTLGRTELAVSVAGLGCGGNSRLGMGTGKSEAESIAVVRTALDLGVNFLDTAENYGTEEIVGKAVAGVPRDDVVISTKSLVRKKGERQTPQQVLAALDGSLRRLGLDHVDVYLLHAVAPADYDYALTEIVPVLLREKDKGRLRHLGITETSPNDPTQQMLQRAVHDACWEVMMFAFHMMNQGARRDVLPHTQGNRIGTLLMFVVRNIFSRPEALRATVRGLVDQGKVPAELAERDNPLDFLLHDGGASSLTEAAYRFVRHEPGVDVVLFGTGNVDHVASNVAAILRPPLPPLDRERLAALFGQLTGVGLDLPDHVKPAP
jgi:aryl-alcohol dehydrogenase-like predicted oxidoreductase